MDNKEASKLVGELAPQVAKELGWTYKDEPNLVYGRHIEGPNGAKLFLHVGYPYKQITISGSFHQRWNLPHGKNRPSIGVGFQKTAAQIAKDIQRRFLPEYLALLAQCDEDMKAEAFRTELSLHNAKRLRTIIGAEEPKKEDRNEVVRVSFYRSTKLQGDLASVKVHVNRVEFDYLHTTVAEAEAILKLLVSMRNQ